MYRLTAGLCGEGIQSATSPGQTIPFLYLKYDNEPRTIAKAKKINDTFPNIRNIESINGILIQLMHMKISARNQLKGTVMGINEGAVNSEILIELPGGDVIVSIITKKAVDNLGLKVGSPAYAIVKASNVLIGAE